MDVRKWISAGLFLLLVGPTGTAGYATAESSASEAPLWASAVAGVICLVLGIVMEGLRRSRRLAA